MAYGYQFLSRTKLTELAKKHAPTNPNTEYELAQAIDAWEQHKVTQEAFFAFLRENNEEVN